MSESNTRHYEGMFLFPQSAGAELQAVIDHITEIVTRHGAEIISLKKWDERRLAYDIKGNKRGIYFLAYLKAEPDMLAKIERDCNLSERLLRAMVTRADHLTAEQMEAADGREQLADEIKLRAEKKDEESKPASRPAPTPEAPAAEPVAAAANEPAQT